MTRAPVFAAIFATLASVGLGCSEAPTAQSTADPGLTITVRDGACVVTARSQQIVLQPKPPCFFVHDEKGRIQIHERRDAAKTRLVLVGGSPANPDPDPIKDGTGPCGTEVQAIAMTADGVRALARIGRGSRICAKQGGVDANYFETFDRDK